MAPPFSLRIPSRTSPEEKEKFTVVYLVRSFGLMPESVSHDWHVQPSCQRPNRGPPKRREFSPGEPAQVRIRLSSKPYKHTARRKSRQSTHPTGFPDVFHTWTDLGSGGGRAAPTLKTGSSPGFQPNSGITRLLVGAHDCTQQYESSARNQTPLSARADTEDKKLRKDPLEVLALKVPFGYVMLSE
jgi:hypothetical protein